MMAASFSDDERLLRAILPPDERPEFWEPDGGLSAAAFKKRDGLSVDRTKGRTVKESAVFMRHNGLRGLIALLRPGDCGEAGVRLLERPSRGNPYHCEIHGSLPGGGLNRRQAAELAERATLYDEELNCEAKSWWFVV